MKCVVCMYVRICAASGIVWVLIDLQGLHTDDDKPADDDDSENDYMLNDKEIGTKPLNLCTDTASCIYKFKKYIQHTNSLKYFAIIL